MDTRQEVERWTNHPVKFHFATILSPWIRRCLIAGGFGYERSSRTHDVTSVVSYDASQAGPSQSEVETGETKGNLMPDPSFGEIRHGEASAVQVDTPYFHLDLAEAVAAAEAGHLTLTPQSSASPSVHEGDDKLDVGQGDKKTGMDARLYA
jgi:solute carrier family 26 (sodium-independent sulfate anion transporter), member 11